MGDTRGAFRVSIGTPEGKRPLGRSRHSWENNNKKDLYEMELGYGLYWSDSENGQVASSFEFGNELFRFHKMRGNSWLAGDILVLRKALLYSYIQMDYYRHHPVVGYFYRSVTIDFMSEFFEYGLKARPDKLPCSYSTSSPIVIPTLISSCTSLVANFITYNSKVFDIRVTSICNMQVCIRYEVKQALSSKSSTLSHNYTWVIAGSC